MIRLIFVPLSAGLLAALGTRFLPTVLAMGVAFFIAMTGSEVLHARVKRLPIDWKRAMLLGSAFAVGIMLAWQFVLPH